MTFQPPAPPPANFNSSPRVGKNNNLAIASFVLGLSGVILSWFIMLIPSLLAIVFGHVSLRQMRVSGENGRNLALTGLILGYVITAMYLVIVIFFLLVVGKTLTTGN